MATEGKQWLWRIAGALAIGHVVLMLGSFSLQRVSDLGAKPSAVTDAFVRFSLARGFAGEYVTCLSFLVFLLVATLLARLLRGDGEVTGWLSSLIATSGAIYVTVTLAAVLPNLGAALYDGHHGASLATVTALDHVHWFGVFVGTAVLGVFTLSVGAAVWVSGALPSWVGYGAVVAGVACLASGEGARTGLNGAATLVWMVWFVGLAVAALRGPRTAAVPAPLAA
jgi:hypothetical protein